MWIFCDSGFFSVVKKLGDDQLTVRARTKNDIERFVKEANTFNRIEIDAGTDYRYRVRVTPEVYAAWLSEKGMAINYANFKGKIFKLFGAVRERVYHRIWSETMSLNFVDWDEQDEKTGKS